MPPKWRKLVDDCLGASDDVKENEGDDGGGVETTTADNQTNIGTGGHNSSAATLTLDSNQHKMSVDASTVVEEIINPGGKTYKVQRKGLNPLALQNNKTVGLEMMEKMVYL